MTAMRQIAKGNLKFLTDICIHAKIKKTNPLIDNAVLSVLLAMKIVIKCKSVYVISANFKGICMSVCIEAIHPINI